MVGVVLNYSFWCSRALFVPSLSPVALLGYIAQDGIFTRAYWLTELLSKQLFVCYALLL
jgi:hypothetical protein